jgi:hypothetical protein
LIYRRLGRQDSKIYSLLPSSLRRVTFSQVGQSIGSGDQPDFSLSHGAVQLAAEQAIADIGTFEVERGCQAVACALVKPSVRRPRFGRRGRGDLFVP